MQQYIYTKADYLELADNESPKPWHALFTDHTTSKASDKSLQNIQYEAMKQEYYYPGGHSNRKIDEFDKYLV